MAVAPPPITSPRWDSRTKRIVALICLLLLALAIWRVNDILPVFIVALILSYLLNPITTFIDGRILSAGNERKDAHRTIAIVLTFLIVLALLTVVVLVVLPVLIDQLQEFARRLPDLLETVETEAERVLSQPIFIGGQEFIPLESIRESVGAPEGDLLPLDSIDIPGTIGLFVGSLTGPAFSFVGGAFSAIINLIFLLTLMFYLLKDGASFLYKAVDITPPSYKNDVHRLLYELGRVWDAYLRGQILLCLIMGTLVFVAATILGVPNAPILGLLSGLLEFIPTLGPAIALVPAVLLALASQSSTLPFLEGVPFAITVGVVWTALQNLEAVVIVPRVMGSSLNLHPIVVILGVLAGASLAGPLGVILAAPTLATLRFVGQYIYGKLLDRDPFPPLDPVQVRRQRRSGLGHRLMRLFRYLRRWVQRRFGSARVLE